MPTEELRSFEMLIGSKWATGNKMSAIKKTTIIVHKMLNDILNLMKLTLRSGSLNSSFNCLRKISSSKIFTCFLQHQKFYKFTYFKNLIFKNY